jgi:hypothetical protein
MRQRAQVARTIGRRINRLGLTLEQLGPEKSVHFELGTDGRIVVFLGEAEHTCPDVEHALGLIDRWAEKVGADPSRPGAIVEFVDQLGQLIEATMPARRTRSFNDLDLSRLLERHGMRELEPGSHAPGLDDGSLLCLVEDRAGARWVVFFDESEEVGYDVADN